MGGSAVKAPKVPDPIATPDQTPQAAEDVMKRKKGGYASTVITGALAPKPKGATLLGGN
jgi:hypothetical protein